MSKRRLMFVFGTRPEAIKLSPVILEANKRRTKFETVVIATAQHREMLDDVLRTFQIIPHEDLNIMSPNQSLFYITSRIFSEMEAVLHRFDPDIVITQGDTTTTFAAALCGFYAGKKVAHVEAGLRTHNKAMPFPEEINRKMTSAIADVHFAPTESAKQNLRDEGYDESTIHVTGNTVIDALLWVVDQIRDSPCPLPQLSGLTRRYPRMVLVTGHRREHFGEPFERICGALRRLALQYPDVAFVYPVHLNPNVQAPVAKVLSGLPNFFLTEPLAYPTFCWFMVRCTMIITDSGGVQEEAPALGKPVLVTRHVTERPEAVEAGMVKVVGDDPDKICHYTTRLLSERDFYQSMAKGFSPYGDGKASGRILDALAAL